MLVFLTVLSTGLHYVIQRMNYKRDLERIEQILDQAKLAAWGPKMIPVGSRRKVGPVSFSRDISYFRVYRSK